MIFGARTPTLGSVSSEASKSTLASPEPSVFFNVLVTSLTK